MPDAPLASMQRGMLGRILGAPVADAMPAIDRNSAAADERLAVYVCGYAERLRGCLATDFPALHAFVGATVFDLFARGYLARCPSRSRSLYDLGAGFADYLNDSAPSEASDPLDQLPSDLARLERARTEAHRARGPEDTGGSDPAVFLMRPQTRVSVPETVRLVRCGFALKDVLDAVDRGERPTIPQGRPALYAVSRVNYRVEIRELSPAQFSLVEAYAADGDFSTAIEAAATADARPNGAVRADILAWMPQAIEAGLLRTHT